jgi:hypothetical protein
MHSDLIFIRSGINHLEQAGAKTVDCQAYGLTSSEPIARVRVLADDWKQPFQKEYTERSVSQAFEKLLALRADVDRNAVRVLGKSLDAAPAKPAEAKAPSSNGTAAKASVPRPAEKVQAAAIHKVEDATPELDFESCMDQVWEQLISAPPSRGRSMTTVRVGGARLLMSSWEVAAFVTEDGPAAEDLRRAVVARALVTAAVEKAKETGNATGLDRVLPIARMEVSRLQERVEMAKQAKDTEAAVNLGISTKRLLSALDEAEKL